MQTDLLTANPATKIRILGVNAAGLEAGNPTITAARTLPWLQDTVAAGVWGSWAVTLRDVVILDALNISRDVYNLTTHDLATPANYNELIARLKAVAGEP